MNYTEYTAALQQMLTISDAAGQAVLAATIDTIIQFAENMIFREPEFDFLATRTTDATQVTKAGFRYVQLAPQLIVLQEVNLIVPANLNNIESGSRVRLLRVDRDFIDITWPMASTTQAPKPFETYWAIYSMEEAAGDDTLPQSNALIIAPTVDDIYTVEQLGIFQPNPLSAQNTQTFLTKYFPDLFLAASMFYATGIVLKNFGLQADNPQQAISWKSVYDTIKSGVAVQSARQKSQVEGFSSWPALPANTQQLQAMAAAAAQRQAA